MRNIAKVVVIFSLLTQTSWADHDFEPSRLEEGSFSALLKQSPFLRIVNLTDNYDLHGVAKIDDQNYATLHHKKTGKRILVGGGADNANGMQLLGVVGNSDPKKVVVKILYYGEEVEFVYGDILAKKNAGPKMKQTIRKDREGRPVTTDELMKKANTLSQEQRRAYFRWKEAQLKARPDLRYSEKRFPIAHKALDAIKAGKSPPTVR